MVADRDRWRAVGSRFRDYLVADAALYAAVAIFVVLALAYLLLTGKFHGPDVAATFGAYLQLWVLDNLIVFPALFLMIGYIRITLKLNNRRALAYRHMFSVQTLARFFAGTMMMIVAFLPFRTMFNSVKTTIPEGQGFLYDRFLADFDKALHFGREPFEWLYAVFKHPWILRAVEINYETIWFVICFGMQYWIVVSPKFDKIRLRYVLCYVLSWVLIGNVAASLVSSAGPIYYAFVIGDHHRFAEIVTFMASSEGQFAATSQFQSYLWYLYANDLPGLGSGISAFPSMHVAIVVMNALFLCEAGRKWIAPSVIYVLFVIASSVYLGWHYAVDGYASAIMTVAIYFGLKKVMAVRWRLWPAREAAPVPTSD